MLNNGECASDSLGVDQSALRRLLMSQNEKIKFKDEVGINR